MTWRRILTLTMGILVFLLATTWVVLQETGATRTFVQAMLGRLLATDFALRDAIVDLAGGTVTLRDLRIGDPVQRGQRLATVERLQVGIDTNPLGDVLSVQTVEVEGLDLRIDLTARRMPNLTEILRLPGTSAEPPKRLPPVRVRRSRVELRYAADAPALQLSGVEIDLLPLRGDPTRAQLSGTAGWADLDLTFALSGSADVRRGEFLATARLSPVRVDDRLLGRLHACLPRFVPDAGVSGALQQVVLWFEHRGAGSAGEPAEGPAAGLVAHAVDVTCTLPEVPYPIVGAAMEISATTAGGGSVRFGARQSGDGGRFDLRGEFSQLASQPLFEIRATGRGILVDHHSLDALGRLPAGANVIAAIAPTAGKVDADLFLQRTAAGAEDLELDLTVADAALSYYGFDDERRIGFALPLVRGGGRVRIRGNTIHLVDLSAEIAPEAGGGRVHCEGTVTTGGEDRDRVSIDVRAPRVQFTAAARAALGRLMGDDGALYDQFAPTGATAVDVRVRAPDAGSWQVRLDTQRAGATWAGFPLAVSDLEGEVLFRPDGAMFDLRGRRGEGAVRTRGRLLFPADKSSRWHTEMWVAADDVILDEDLRRASAVLNPDLDSLWAELRPEGRGSADVTVWRRAGEEDFGYDVRLSTRNARCALGSLPMPLQAVQGDVFVHGRGRDQRVDLDGLRAELEDPAGGTPASVALVGSMRRIGGRRRSEDLTAVVRDLKLDDRLAESLDRIGALRRSSWNVLKPSGTVDVVLHRTLAAAGDRDPPVAHHELAVQLRNIRSDMEMLPERAHDVSGELRVVDGKVTFRGVQARLGTALVHCSEGSVEPLADDPTRTEIRFSVSSERFPVDDRLSRLFEGPMRRTILRRQLKGSATVPSLELRLVVPPEGSGEPFATSIAGSVGAQDVSMLLGTRVEAINGLVTISQGEMRGNQGLIVGQFQGVSFRLFDQPCEQIDATFEIDPRTARFPSLTGSLHGGRVRGRDGGGPALVYVMSADDDEPGVLAMDMEITNVDLSELLRHGGMQNPPFSGALRGDLRLDRLHGIDFVDMEGEGSLQVVGGNLGTVPVFTAIYALLNESNRPRFDSAAVRFQVNNRIVELQDLMVSSPLIQVSGRGTMTMEGYLDVTLTLDNLFGGSANLLLLPPLFQAIASSLVRFHLFGHLRDLQAEQRWFTERDPRRRRQVPVPPRIEHTRRPDY